MEKYVGERIRKARNAKKMSQQDLGDIVDARRQTIGEYERGGDIPLSMLEKIAKVLDSGDKKRRGNPEGLPRTCFSYPEIPDTSTVHGAHCRTSKLSPSVSTVTSPDAVAYRTTPEARSASKTSR